MKKQIITIAGTLGSGKSSTADMIARNLGFKRFSSGNFFRQVGLELGLSINEINKRAETDPEIDKKTDQKLRDLRNTEKIVIDSRTAYHWIPESFKVYLDLPPEIAKERVMNNIRENELRKKSEQVHSVNEVYKKMQQRFESEQKRYWNLYKINNRDLTQYNLVIDTKKNNLKEVVDIIIREYKNWFK